eukprot:1364843-Prymnesium_polylepis.1
MPAGTPPPGCSARHCAPSDSRTSPRKPRCDSCAPWLHKPGSMTCRPTCRRSRSALRSSRCSRTRPSSRGAPRSRADRLLSTAGRTCRPTSFFASCSWACARAGPCLTMRECTTRRSGRVRPSCSCRRGTFAAPRTMPCKSYHSLLRLRHTRTTLLSRVFATAERGTCMRSCGRALEELSRQLGALPRIEQRVADLQGAQAEGHELLEQIREDVLVVRGLSLASQQQLAATRQVLMRGMFEATEVTVPSTFIIVDQKLPEETDVRLAGELLHLVMREDGSGVDVGGELGELYNQARERYEEGTKWLQG